MPCPYAVEVDGEVRCEWKTEVAQPVVPFRCPRGGAPKEFTIDNRKVYKNIWAKNLQIAD